MKIVSFHLYNDNSGSPRVLHMVLEDLLKRGHEVTLVTSRGGILDSLSHPNLRRVVVPYQFSNNFTARMLRYIFSQVISFFVGMRYLGDKERVFYINTILPAGGAIAGKLTGHRVVYHYHEHVRTKGRVYRILSKLMQRIADAIICVSESQKEDIERKKDVRVVPNTLPASFFSQLKPNPELARKRKNVLMISSLKEYKGIPDFIALARRMPQYRFTLVVGDTKEHIDQFIKDDVPENLDIHTRTDNTAAYYNNASMVVNLSDANKFIESFGLTALEGMAAGLPVIVPEQGGIAELVAEGKNGFHIDSHRHDVLESRITQLLEDNALYQAMANEAIKRSAKYTKTANISFIELSLSER